MVLRVFRFGCLLLVVACSRLDPAAELAAARIDFESGSFQTASIRLSNVLRADPENAEAHLLRGELALAIGDYELAVNELNRALALGAASDHVAVSLADAAARKGDHELAIGTLESALPGLTGEAGYWLVRADVLTRAGSPDEANAALERAAALGAEGSVSYLIAQGRLAALRGDSARAESLLREAVKQGQTSAEAHQALGDLYSHLNRLTEAAVELAAAADLFRSSGRFWKEVRVLAELVQVQLALNDLDSAERTAARLSEALPEAPMTSYVRGLVEYRQGRFDAAVVSLQKAVAGGPRNSHFLTLLAAAQLAQGNLGQAEQHLLRVLAADPRDPAAIKLLAETRLRQRRPDAALEALSPLAGATTEDAHVGFLTGIATILTGDVERGITYLEQAAALDPGNELLKLELARVYSVVGREAEALELMRGTWGAGGDALLARVLELLSFARAGDTESGERAVTELLAEYPSDERAFLAAALYRQATNQPREARQLLETAVELDRESIRARLLLAAALIQEGRAQDAERHLRDALALAPDNIQVLTSLAQFVMARGRLAESEELLRRAVQRSSNVAPRLLLANLYTRSGRLDEAREIVREAGELAPGHAEVQLARGRLALAEGRVQDALALLSQAHDRLPYRHDLTLALAEAYLGNRQPDLARATLRAALQSAERSLPLRFALGLIELRLGASEQALSIAKDLKAEFPQLRYGYLLEAHVEIARRRYDEAVGLLRVAYEQERVWIVLAELVAALQLAERLPEAVALLEDWISREAADNRARLLLASLLQADGRTADALHHYETVLEHDDRNVVALNNAAWLYQLGGDPRALALAERAYALQPENPAVLDTLGTVLLRENREEVAIGYLEKAAQLAPNALDIRYRLAQAQVELGRNAEARATLEALLSEDRPFEHREAAQALLATL